MPVKKSIIGAWFWLMLTAPLIVLALDLPAPAVVEANSGLFQWILGIALLGIGALGARFIRDHDKHHEQLTDTLASQGKEIHTISNDLSKLMGEHEAYKSKE